MISLEDNQGVVKSGKNGVRERTLQAVQYYNNNVLKVRNNQKFSRLPTTCNSSQKVQDSRTWLRSDNLYRSNSSLELLNDNNHHHPRSYFNNNHNNNLAYSPRNNLVNSPLLRREYGSHGSIDIISAQQQQQDTIRPALASSSEQFFAMLQDYQPAVFDVMTPDRSNSKIKKISDNPSSSQKYNTSSVLPGCSTSANTIIDDDENNDYRAYVNKNNNSNHVTSPKPKSKISRFWGTSSNISKTPSHHTDGEITNGTTGISTIVQTSYAHVNGIVHGSGNSNSPELEEKQRRRAFAHYDCQSMMAKLGQHDSKLKGLLCQRRNTTTGASAASMATRSSTPDGDSGDEDLGDGRCNDLVESCPFFRNEIGGEDERVISLTRNYSSLSCKQQSSNEPYHNPVLSRGISILEFPAGETHWKNHCCCPYKRNYKTIENVDEGAFYYRRYFYGQDHQNWFGIDENLGPVAVSIKREKLDVLAPTQVDGNITSSASAGNTNAPLFRYRLIVRTSELQTLRGSVLEDAIPNLKSSQNTKNFNAKEVLEYVVPEIQLPCLRLGVNSAQIEEQLLKLDEQGVTRHYKVGILYCRGGQSTEEEMYNNEDGGAAFNEFLETIGHKIRLKGFDKYKAGLDNKSDSTGLYSMYSLYQNCEIMFHVSTLLPFTQNNRQQLLRKRHIGNDIVTIVFQEPGAHPFSPKSIRSQFQHVFIIIRAIHPCSDRTQYSVAVTRSKDVALFGPPIPKGSTFNKSKNFADFLLAKVINAENAAHRSDKFAAMATRTRQAYLKDLTLNCATSTVLETSQKFSMLSFSSKKKERWRPRFTLDTNQTGAICWQIMLEDSIQSTIIHCYLAISTDSIVLMDEYSNSIVFATSCKSVLGWTAQSNSFRLYYHEGECITMHMRESSDRDELMEVVVRLRSVTNGYPTQELSLKRNSTGQLGFHVQPDGVVTQVENMGLAWQAGLRQGSRLVEICKVAVTTLSHDQMVDLLKTSLLVTVTVIPSLSDNIPRRGCTLQSCKYHCFSCEGDYENTSSPQDPKLSFRNSATLQQTGNHRKMYERSFSPPRSCNSSGYGTGSSSKSYSSMENRFSSNNADAVMTSLSSGNSSDDRWYDMLDSESVPGGDFVSELVPPPTLPARAMTSSFSSALLSSSSGTTAIPLQKSASHSKIKASTSLPLSGTSSSYSLPASDLLQSKDSYTLGTGESVQEFNFISAKPSDTNNRDFDSSINSGRTDEKLACLMKAERSREFRRYLDKEHHDHYKSTQDVVYRERNDKSPGVLSQDVQRIYSMNDDHLTDTSSTSERAFPPSEDELSVESNGNGSSCDVHGNVRVAIDNVCPTVQNISGSASSVSASSFGESRNSSPKLKYDTGEARLRSTIISRSINRNSANLSCNSTLQQDLMKLINLDYNPNETCNKGVFENSSHSKKVNSSNDNAPVQIPNNVNRVIRENNKSGTTISRGKEKVFEKGKKDAVAEIVKNLNKPVIKSIPKLISNESPTASCNQMSSSDLSSVDYKLRDNGLSQTNNASSVKENPPCLPLPDTKEMDWHSLVDTATKAMMQVSSSERNTYKSPSSSSFLSSLQSIQNEAKLHQWIGDVEMLENQRFNENMNSHRQEFHKYLSELESRLMKETQKRLTLEKEVHTLKDENRRLQQESQSAAQQLRTFTEWFFQNIDKR